MSVRIQVEVSQPFDIACQKAPKGARCVTSQGVKSFWASGAVRYAEKQGCYIFALRAGKGYTPWYVGKTKKQNFQKECFATYQLGKYNQALFGRNGSPVMFFVAPGGNKNVLPKEVISEMERFLIQQGHYENPKILNKANARHPEWGIKGVLRSGQGQPNSDAKAFRRMMGL
jgi:hypothetical protein